MDAYPASLRVGQEQYQPNDPLLPLLMASGLALPQIVQMLQPTQPGNSLQSVPAPQSVPTANPSRGNQVGSIGQVLAQTKEG